MDAVRLADSEAGLSGNIYAAAHVSQMPNRSRSQATGLPGFFLTQSRSAAENAQRNRF
jgi:hypothetical protein